MENFDLIVIGGGRAANLASKVAKLGKKVALIEKSKLGGTCANRGCVPSKLLIGYAEVIRKIQESKRHSIDSSITHIDIENIFKENKEYIDSVEEFYLPKLNKNVKLYRGEGTFISNKVIEVNNQKLASPTIIIATGSRPKTPPFKYAWTSDDVFPIKKIPKSISIVGAGFIACELANIFDALGVETKLLVRGDTLLKNEDKDISSTYKEQLSKKIDILFHTEITDALYGEDHFDITIQNKDNKSLKYKAEALLYAIGRESNSDLLGFENTSIQLDKKGYIKRDKFYETDAKGVYVVGDADGKYMLQHTAAYEMEHLYKVLYKQQSEPLQFKYIPHAVFSDPEIASVGVTENEALDQKLDFVAVKTSWEASAKAQATKLKYPFTKFIVEPQSYKILGCHMIGPQSSTMIHQVLTVMHIDNDIRHLKEMLYIHPALSEALLPASINVIKKIRDI
jgi:dihydrolipoamide dehydrogenase